MTISKEILDELLKGLERPEDLLGDAGLMLAPKPAKIVAIAVPNRMAPLIGRGDSDRVKLA